MKGFVRLTRRLRKDMRNADHQKELNAEACSTIAFRVFETHLRATAMPTTTLHHAPIAITNDVESTAM
jgi:hypothetical protein